VRGTAPHFRWPTSKPGPQATAPPPGQKPMPKRTDQVVEIGYNQETGTPSTDHPLRSMPDASLHGTPGFDQLETAQQAMKNAGSNAKLGCRGETPLHPNFATALL
jgi:hypothetical protein